MARLWFWTPRIRAQPKKGHLGAFRPARLMWSGVVGEMRCDIDFIWSDLEKYHAWETVLKIQKWSGKTEIVILCPKQISVDPSF